MEWRKKERKEADDGFDEEDEHLPYHTSPQPSRVRKAEKLSGGSPLAVLQFNDRRCCSTQEYQEQPGACPRCTLQGLGSSQRLEARVCCHALSSNEYRFLPAVTGALGLLLPPTTQHASGSHHPFY